MTPNQAIAQALLRCAERVKEFEKANLPREGDRILSQWRAGRRSAAMEIAAWLIQVAEQYESEAQ